MFLLYISLRDAKQCMGDRSEQDHEVRSITQLGGENVREIVNNVIADVTVQTW